MLFIFWINIDLQIPFLPKLDYFALLKYCLFTILTGLKKQQMYSLKKYIFSVLF